MRWKARTGLAVIFDVVISVEANIPVDFLASFRGFGQLRIAVGHRILPRQAPVDVEHRVVRGRACVTQTDTTMPCALRTPELKQERHLNTPKQMRQDLVGPACGQIFRTLSNSQPKQPETSDCRV